jgi:hypothetical protein
MSETTGSATGLEDFFAKFLTWVATVPGWTVDESISTVDSGRQCAISKGNLYVQFRWNTASPNSVAVYQSTGFAAATRAGLQAGDSGNGYNTNNGTSEANITGERCIELMGNSAFPSYYFYTNASGDYLHVAVEVGTDQFRHFGCGNLLRFGDWDTAGGGEYVYGHAGAGATSATLSTTCFLLDGAASATTGAPANDRGGTIRMNGWPNQAAQVYGHVWGNRVASELTDSAGNPRLTVIGGGRGGVNARAFGWLGPNTNSGLAPVSPIPCWYIDRSVSPFNAYLMGFMPAVRYIHLRNLAPKDTFALGGETWRVFPQVRRVEGSAAGDTDVSGVAYLTNDAS